MKTIIFSVITVGAIIAITIGTMSYQHAYNQNCIADDGKITGFLQCTRTFEDFALPNPMTVELVMGQVFQYENLELEFYDIEDSRCPLDVTCVWEGKVTAMIHVRNQTHKIAGYFEPGHSVSYISPYTVTLLDVTPHPVSTEKPDYTSILKISK